MKRKIFLGIVLVAVLAGILAMGQSVPQFINYQGRLTDSSGQPLDGATVDITFSFYGAASGGTAYLSVFQQNVLVNSGIYNILIGSGTISPGTEFSLSDVFVKHKDVWMGVKVNTDPEMTPRSRISSVPYALAVDVDSILNNLWSNPDQDADGYESVLIGGLDCNDGNSSIGPDATEVSCDGIDQDCDGIDCCPCPVYSWTKKIGANWNDGGQGVSTDISGNVYVTGYFEDSVDFAADWGGSDLKNSAGSQDIFITRINADNSYEWTKRIGGNGNDYGKRVLVDDSANIYVVGSFGGTTVDFAADWGGSDLKNSAGSADIFITKINANGSYGWTKTFGGIVGDFGYGVSVDSAGNIYLTGGFEGSSVNFSADWGGSDEKTSAGFGDVFVIRINADGSYGWTRRIGGIGNDSGMAISAEGTGCVYVTGSCGGTVNFASDWGGSDEKNCQGISDIFITKINSDGSYGWTRSMGGSDNDWGSGVSVDGSGKVYIAGAFSDIVNFASNWGGNDEKISAGNYDAFVTRINSDGSYGWTRRIGGIEADYCNDVSVDNNGNAYLTGSFLETVNFASDWGGLNRKTSTDSDKADIFITRIDSDGSYGWTKRIGGKSYDYGRSVSIDGSGNVYLTGSFDSSVNFSGDWGGRDVKTGYTDIFLTKISQP